MSQASHSNVVGLILQMMVITRVMSDVTIQEFDNFTRWYWSFDDVSSSPNAAMSAEITSVGTQAAQIEEGKKRNSYQVTSVTHEYEISLPTSCLFLYNCLDGYTVSFWIKVMSPASDRQVVMTSGGDLNDHAGFTVVYDGTTQEIEVSATDTTLDYGMMSFSMYTDAWTHIAFVIDPIMPGMQLWKSGSYIGHKNDTSSRAGACTNTQNAILIGKSNAGVYTSSNFLIDELHLWEVDASMGQIKKLYTQSGLDSVSEFWIDFDHIYQNNLISGEVLPIAENGTIKQIKGRYGRGLEIGVNTAINLGNYSDCITFTYPMENPIWKYWCEYGFTFAVWLRFPKVAPAGYTVPRIIMGTVDVISDTNSSGFALLDYRGSKCVVKFIQRNNDFYQDQNFDCAFDTWMFLGLGYHPALGGFYRKLYESSFHSNAVNNLFAMSRIMVNGLYSFERPSTLYIGHHTRGAFFQIDDLYLSGKVILTSKMGQLDPAIIRKEIRGTSGPDGTWRPNVIRGSTNKFSPVMNIPNKGETNEKKVLQQMIYSSDSFYFNGINAYCRLSPVHHLAQGHEDVEHRYGFSFNFWIYQCGTRDTVTTAYYVDSGGVEDTDWGYTVYYNGGFLNVVVSTSRYEWRQLLPFGFKQWIHFAMSWYPDTGFEVYLNHINQGLYSKRTKRPNPQNRVTDNQEFYCGRPSTYSGNLADVSEPMYIARIFFWDRVSKNPSYLHTTQNYHPHDYGHQYTTGPRYQFSRHIWNASNNLDAPSYDTNWLDGSLLFELLNGAKQVYRNDVFNMSVTLDGSNQLIRSDVLVTQCISNPDYCFWRSHLLSFWIKPINLAGTPAGEKRSFLWVGSDNATVISFYHLNGNNTIELSGQTIQCVQTIYLPDNEWTWVTMKWEFKNYAKEIKFFNVTNNTIDAINPPVCSPVTRVKTTSFGRIVFGAEAVEHYDGPYVNFNQMEVDDIFLKDTFLYTHGSWTKTKSTGHKTNYNWFGEPRYLNNFTAPDLYLEKDCIQYVDIGRFHTDIPILRISPVNGKIYHVRCRLIPDVEVTETEVFLRLEGKIRDVNDTVGRTPSFEGNYSVDEDGRAYLRANSISCRQQLSLTCNGARLFSSPYSTHWLDMAGTRRYYWSGANDDFMSKCDCGVKEDCYDPTASCNCNGHAGWDIDDGYLNEKDRLPVMGLSLEPAYGTAYGYWDLGNLICQNIDPNGMHYILDTFSIVERYPGRGGTFFGTRNSAMIQPGIYKRSKAIQLDGSTNYISLPNFLDVCFVDITQCPKGFSTSLWVRVPNLATDAVFISNKKETASKGTGFSVGLTSGRVVCDIRYLTTRTTISAVISHDVWVQIGVTWKADRETILYINGHNVKTMGATETITANSKTNPGTRLLIGNDASSLGVLSPMSVDEAWFSPFYYFTPPMMTLRATLHTRVYVVSFDQVTYPSDLLATTEVFLEKNLTPPLEIPGVVNGAFRLYHPNLDIARLYKNFYYECLGNLDLCYDGLSFGLWARLHPDMWTETTNFHTLFSVTGSAASSPGFHMYFKGRDATLEIRDIAAGKELLSKFDIPIEKWFHFMFTWRTGSNPSIYINSFTVPVTHTQNMKSFTAASPPDTVLYLSYSTQFASYKTLADVDDLTFDASVMRTSGIKDVYGKGYRKLRFPFDNSTILGDVKTTVFGSPIIIYGRVLSAIYLRGPSFVKSEIPFYLECFSNPSRCNSAITVSFWLFLRSTYTAGTILSALNTVGRHGFTVTYTCEGNDTMGLNVSVFSQTKMHTAIVTLSERTWNHIAFRWAVNGSSMVWVNGTETGNWTGDTNAIGTEGDVYLVFGSDSSYSETADMAIDEFYFREAFESTDSIIKEFGLSKNVSDDLFWSVDAVNAGGDIDGTNIMIDSQSAVYGSGIHSNAAILDGIENFLNMGAIMGTCMTHLEFCQSLNVQFKLMFEGPQNGDQYIISRTTADSSQSGFYLRYANLNSFIPCRRYYQAGVKHVNKIWNVTFNMDPHYWMGFHMKWSQNSGLEIWIDGILVEVDRDPEDEPGISELTDTTNFVVGKANDGSGQFAHMRMDDINVWDGEVGPPGVNLTDDWLYQGCFLAPGNPAKTKTMFDGISPYKCRTYCGHTYRHIGISEGIRCACIDNIEIYTHIASPLCSLNCGGTNYNCGNDTVMLHFSIYRSTSHKSFPTIYPIVNCTTNVTGQYDDYDLDIDLVDEDANFTLEVTCDQGNYICYIFTMADGSAPYITGSHTIYHIYDNVGTYNGDASLRNEMGEVLVPYTIKVTFPLKPIANLTINAIPTLVNTVADINMSLSQGNDLNCSMEHGDGTSRVYYKKDYEPTHMLTKTYTATGDYTVIMQCSNPISSANVSTMISIQRPISSTSLNHNRGSFWVFELDTHKTLSWSTIGSHLYTELVLDGQPVEVKFNSQSVVFNESEFNTIGSHLGWIIIQNDVSSSANISFEMRVERPITEAHIVLYPFAPAGSSYTTCVLIPSGSNAAVEFTFTPPTVLQKTLLGNIENGTVCFSGVLNTVGEFTVNCSVYNNLTVSPGIRNSSFVVVENEVKEVEITVFNSSTLQFPISVNASHMVGAADPTNAMVIVSATKQGENISVSCYSSLHGGFRDIEAECVIASSGWYNMTVEVFNNVSHQVAWKVVELGDKLSGLEFKIAKSIVAVGSIATVLVKIPNGIGTGAYVDFKDGYISPGTLLVIESFTPVNHIYSQHGNYNISVFVTNQISSRSDECQEPCIIAQENITGLTFTQPLAFEFALPIKVNWTKKTGSHLNYSASIDGRSISTFTETENGGFMEVSTLAWLGLGFHTVNVEAVNDVSGPEAASAQIVIVKRIKGFRTSLSTFAEETHTSLQLNYHIDGGTKTTVNFKSQSDILGSKYYESISNLDDTVDISFTTPDVYLIYGKAYNPLHEVSNSPLTLVIQNPVVNGLVDITTVDTYISPVQIMIDVNPGLDIPTNFSISINFGDGTDAIRSDLIEHNETRFGIGHIFPTDGLYVINMTIENIVSEWAYQEEIMVGIPVSNVSLIASNITLKVNETLIINATVKQGSNMEITYDFGVDNITEVHTVLAGELHQTTFQYARPGVYRLFVIARNSFSQVERILSNLIYVQYPIDNITLTSPNEVYAVGSDINVVWTFTSGTNISCELYYAGQRMFHMPICEMNDSLTINGLMSETVTVNEVKVVAWNLVTPKREMAIPLQIERPIKGLNLVLQYSKWPIRKYMLLKTTIEEGTKINVIMSLNNTIPDKQTQFPVGDFDHLWKVNTTFEVTGFVEVTVVASNLLGEINTSSIVQIQGPIFNGRVEYAQPDDYKTPLQTRLILNENDIEPTDLQIYCDLGDGNSVNMTSFIHAFPNLWILNYNYAWDGHYNISIRVENDVSFWNSTDLIQVGEYVNNITISVSEYVVSTARDIIVGVELLNGSNVLIEYDFGEYGSIIESNATRGEKNEMTYIYTFPGTYWLTIRVWNVFNALNRTHHTVIMALDMVRGLKLEMDRSAYAIAAPITLIWEVPMGTNISCELELDTHRIYSESLCNNTGQYVVPYQNLPLGIGNYTAVINVWNLVTRIQRKVAIVRLEQLLREIDVTISHPFRAQGQSSSFLVEVQGGSNYGLEILYSDGYAPINMWYTGSPNFTSENIFRHFPLTGDVTIITKATNIISSINSSATVEVQAPVLGLYVTPTNTTLIDAPANLTVLQAPDLLRPTHVIFHVYWGDRSESIYSDIYVNSNTSAIVGHVYQKEGIFDIKLVAYNNLSSQVLYSRVQIGEAIQGLKATMEKNVVQPSEKFKICVNITQGSNASITAKSLHDTWNPFETIVIPLVGQCLRYSFENQEIYTINFTAQNTFGEISDSIEVAVEAPITGLKLVPPRSCLGNVTSDIRVSFYTLGLQYCVLLDPGDGGDSYVYGIVDCATRHSDHIYIAPLPEESYFVVPHVFRFTGEYIANLSAYNIISNVELTQEIKVIFCKKPVVTLNGRGATPYLPMHIYRSQEIKLDANVLNPCTIPWNMTMNWTVEVWPEKGNHFYYEFEQPDSPILLIPPRTLPYGYVKVTFYTKIGPYDGIEDQDIKYITIGRTPLVASLKGGKAFVLKKENDIVIDARPFCFDPDYPNDKTSLKFVFRIRKSGTFEWITLTDAHTDYVARKKRALSDLDEGVIHLADSLTGLFELMVIISKGSRETTYSQLIHLTEMLTIEAYIGCYLNCEQKVTSSKQLTVTGSCIDCESKGMSGSITYSWKLFELSGNTRKEIILTNKTSTGTSSRILGLQPDILKPGYEYSIRLNISSELAHGFSEYYIVTNLPPYGGTCEVSPERGVATFDKYVIMCKNWKDEGLSVSRNENIDKLRQDELYYTYLARPAGRSDFPFTVVHFGPGALTPELNLPIGYKSYDYTVDIQVIIEDALGEGATFDTSVQVGEFYLKYDEIITKIDSEVTEFDFHFASQDVRAILNSANSFVEQLDRRAEVEECNGDHSVTNMNKEDLLKRQQIRSSLIDKLIGGSGWLVDGDKIKQAATVVASLTRVTKELVVDAMKNASYFLEDISIKLTTLRELDPTRVIEISSEIVQGVSNLLEASEPTSLTLTYQTEFEAAPEDKSVLINAAMEEARKKLIIERDIAKYVVYTGLRTIDELQKSVLAKRLPSESAVKLQSPQIKILLQRIEKSNLHKQDITLDGSRFTLPKDVLSGYQKSEANMQVVSSKGKLFTWHDSVSRLMTTSVGLKFSSEDGVEIKVNDLSEEIRIELPFTKLPSKIPTKISIPNPKKESDEYVVHNITYASTTNAIQFRIEPSDYRQMYQLLIRHNAVATDSDFDFKTIVKESNKFTYRWIVPDGNGTYYVAVKDVTRKKYLPIQYNAHVEMSGCLYWNIDKDIWTTDGCTAIGMTDKDLTCGCNHLTFFAGDFFVAPNTIDFDTVFKKFANIGDNLAVLLTVAALILLFWLIALILRRLDIKDIEKWKVRPLLDNSAEDRYQYILTVITGTKIGSGTRSKVHFIIVGDDGDSDVRVINDGKRKELPKGSIHHYLVTTPRDLGELRLVRVWHDGSGKGSQASWFLREMIVYDIAKQERFHFICDAWLAAEKGDGSIERVIPPSTSVELKQFTRLFGDASRKGLTDQHLWFSVFSRPHRSSFTRVQRWGCCISLLFTSMIASAMWFGTIDENDTGQAIKIGPFAWSTKQFFIATMTAIIVFPVNFIIITLFKKSKPEENNEKISASPVNKEVVITSSNLDAGLDSFLELFPSYSNKNTSQHKNFDLFQVGSEDNKRNIWQQNSDLQKKHTAVKPWYKQNYILPYWCKHIAWVLVFLSMVASGFFVILYSVEWGKEKSELWLSAMFIGFAESVLLLQPIKVLVVAMLMALIFKDPVVEEVHMEKDVCLFENSHNTNHVAERAKLSLHKQSPVDESQVQTMRAKREREMIMEGNLRQIISYSIYLVVIILISFGQRDPMAYYVTKHIEDYALQQSRSHNVPMNSEGFDDVLTFQDYENWANGVLLPALMPTMTYNNENIENWRELRYGSFDGNYIRVGGTRLRQIRVKTGRCSRYKNLHFLFDNICSGEYSKRNADTDDYYPEWKTTNLSLPSSPWTYKESGELGNLPLWGNLAVYGGGGYVLDHSPSFQMALEQQKALFASKWLDRHTRAVTAEFVLYNPNANLFAVVNILLEMTATGSMAKWWDINVMNLYGYSGNYAIFRICAEIVFLGFVFYNMFIFIQSVKKKKKAHFIGLLAYVDFGLLLGSLVVIILFIVRYFVVRSVMGAFSDDNDGVLEFSKLGFYDRTITCCTGILVFFASARMLFLLTFNERIEMLCKVLLISAHSLTHFVFAFIIVMIAFSAFAFTVFGTSLASYASFMSSFESLLAAFVGARMFNSMQTEDSKFGRVFFLTFVLVMLFLMTNILISILNDAIEEVKQQMKERIGQHEFLAYITDRIKDIIGIDNASPESKGIPLQPRSDGTIPKCLSKSKPQGYDLYKDLYDTILSDKDDDLNGIADMDHSLQNIVSNYGHNKGKKYSKQNVYIS